LKENKIGNFEYPQDVKEVLSSLSFKRKKGSLSKNKFLNSKLSAFSLSKSKTLDLEQSFSLLRKNNIEIISSLFVKNLKDLKTAANKIKFPLVMKVVSQEITHKTDVGGIKLNLRTLNEVEEAWREIVKKISGKGEKKPQIKIEGVILQPMTKGKEVIIGMKKDPIFGPVIVFGLGGIFVEILKDVSMRVAPLNKKDAKEMIEEIKGYKILQGARGAEPINFIALEKVILSLSRLVLKYPDIKEIDFNPVIVNKKEALIIDARIIKL